MLDDTHPLVAAKQRELLRQAGPERRAEIACSLSHTMIELSRRELAAQMPGATPLEVKLRWVELNYGKDLASRVRAYLADRRG